MPRCYPPEPEFGAGRAAERAVWEALRDQLPDEAVLFYSVGLLERDREFEADLVVGWPDTGIAVIEVKGGQVSCQRRQWYQTSGSRREPIGSPVTQAQDCRHVLSRLLANCDSPAAHARMVHLVAFPYTAVPAAWSAPDCDRSMVIDSADRGHAADAVRRALREHGGGHAPLDHAGLDSLVDILEGELAGQASLLSAAAENELRIDQLTRDQTRLLDILRYQRRLKVVGGAGTGKTWLALEQARRLARAGQRVALVCYSRGLARFFERATACWPVSQRPAYVGLFHQLPVRWGAAGGAEDDSDYWERRLPLALGELARAKPPAELFDSVVVDEAQDFGALWWPPTLACLRDPAAGGLFVFLDEAQRVFARRGEVPIPLPPTSSTRTSATPSGSPRSSAASARNSSDFAVCPGRRALPPVPHRTGARRSGRRSGPAARRLGAGAGRAVDDPPPAPAAADARRGAGAGGLLGRVLRRDRRLLRPRAGLQGPGAAGGGALRQRFP